MTANLAGPVAALVVPGSEPGAPPLSDDLSFVGIDSTIICSCSEIVHRSVTDAPEMVIIYATAPGAALFDTIKTLSAVAPRPVIVFTTDPDAEKIATALEAGIHAYVVNGYGQARLRSVIHLARARFRREQVIRGELAEVHRRFEERKLVDRAKGILMGARQVREDDAYRALRRSAMHSKQRIGQVSQRVIDAARYAEAVNRAGQLRMLSQRAVKLYALRCLTRPTEETKRLHAETIAQVEDTIAILSRSLSQATFGDLMETVLAAWTRLRAVLSAAPSASRAGEADQEAEEMLSRSERLTANLELAGAAGTLRVINLAGRQRMLSQRIAKAALVAILTRSAPRELDEAAEELVQALADLRAAPLSNAEIAADLDLAAQAWDEFRDAIEAASAPERIVALSETLLELFERVTGQFERGMHAMI